LKWGSYLITVPKEALEYLRITQKTLLKLVKEGHLKGNKVGRNYRFLKEDLNKFIRGETENLKVASK
jgi:excisionase family DNA binding protein